MTRQQLQRLAAELEQPPHRVETIVALLEHLPDYETTAGRDGNGSDGGPSLMPTMWNHPSVKELHRTLNQLKMENRIAWFHLQTYYRAPMRTVLTRRRVRTSRGPRWEDGPPKLERVLPAGLVPGLVDTGTSYTITRFHGEPYLPNELRTELPAEIAS